MYMYNYCMGDHSFKSGPAKTRPTGLVAQAMYHNSKKFAKSMKCLSDLLSLCCSHWWVHTTESNMTGLGTIGANTGLCIDQCSFSLFLHMWLECLPYCWKTGKFTTVTQWIPRDEVPQNTLKLLAETARLIDTLWIAYLNWLLLVSGCINASDSMHAKS